MPSVRLDELRVYLAAEELADAVWTLVETWPSFARDTVGKQIVRAADSVGANIAEGFGRGSYIDNRRFVKIARGSLYETGHFLRRAEKRGLMTTEAAKSFRIRCEALAPQLNAYLRSIGLAGKIEPMTNDEAQRAKDK